MITGLCRSCLPRFHSVNPSDRRPRQTQPLQAIAKPLEVLLNLVLDYL